MHSGIETILWTGLDTLKCWRLAALGPKALGPLTALGMLFCSAGWATSISMCLIMPVCAPQVHAASPSEPSWYPSGATAGGGDAVVVVSTTPSGATAEAASQLLRWQAAAGLAPEEQDAKGHAKVLR